MQTSYNRVTGTLFAPTRDLRRREALEHIRAAIGRTYVPDKN
jgi:hypothetical protein